MEHKIIVFKTCCKFSLQRHQLMTRIVEKTAAGAVTRLLRPQTLLTTRAKKSPQWALSRYQVPTKACYCRNNSTRIAYLDENKSFSRNWWISFYYLVYVRQFCQNIVYHTMWSPNERSSLTINVIRWEVYNYYCSLPDSILNKICIGLPACTSTNISNMPIAGRYFFSWIWVTLFWSIETCKQHLRVKFHSLPSHIVTTLQCQRE